MNYLNILICVILGYTFGCIQTAYMIGRIVKNIDIREQGSHNAGASNVTQIMGFKYGIITAFLDISKAIIAVLCVRFLFPNDISLPFIAGAFTIIGHIFPIHLGFRGGKGAASLIGMVLAIDIKIALILILSIVLITLLIDYISLGTITIFILLPLCTYFMNYPLLCTILGILLSILCIYKHSSNMIRILHHEEVGLRSVIKNNHKASV